MIPPGGFVIPGILTAPRTQPVGFVIPPGTSCYRHCVSSFSAQPEVFAIIRKLQLHFSIVKSGTLFNRKTFSVFRTRTRFSFQDANPISFFRTKTSFIFQKGNPSHFSECEQV